jgi:hypothetical protein
MTDVEYFHFFLFLQNSVNNAMDMRFVAVKQVPESIALGCDRAAIWLLLEAENGLLQMFSADPLIEAGKIVLRAWGGLNPICHAWLRTRQRTPGLAGLYPSGRLPNPGGCLHGHPGGRSVAGCGNLFTLTA